MKNQELIAKGVCITQREIIMSYYIVEDERIVLSNTLNAIQHYTNTDIDCDEVEPEELPTLLGFKSNIFNLDWQSYLYLDGKPNGECNLFESNDRSYILVGSTGEIFEPFFVFKAINGKNYFTNNIGLYHYSYYRVLNLSKDELRRIWLNVEKGQSLDDFIQEALYNKTYIVEEEIKNNRMRHIPPRHSIYIDDEYFELLEEGYYTEFLEEVLEIDLEQFLNN